MTGSMNQEFKALLELGDKRCCPTCGRWAQVYRRQIYGTVAAQLIKMYRLGGAQEYIHTRNLVGSRATGVGDFSKGKYWGLIEEAPVTSDNKNHSGMWRLTPEGVAFVLRQSTIPRYALVYDDKLLKFNGPQFSIEDCLGEAFNYQELISQ